MASIVPIDRSTTPVNGRQISKAMESVASIGRAIRELGEVPNGHLYAMLMTAGVTLDDYTRCVDLLKKAGLVTETAQHLLVWKEPNRA
jgi:hypothetical protein